MSAQVRAFLVCDQAFQQAGSGSWHIIGIHDLVTVPALPATHAGLVVYWQLGDFAGDATVTVAIRDNVGAPVHAARAMIPPLPSHGLEQAFAFPPVTFRTAGSHSLELLVAEEVLAVRSFHVRIADEAVPPENPAGR